MSNVSREWIEETEKRYPGMSDIIKAYRSEQIPPCPRCGSEDTATVITGLVGRSMALAAATRKVHLLANGHPGDYYCWTCGLYFGLKSRQARGEGARESGPLPKDLGDAPPETSDIDALFRFAYEYDGYVRHGGFNRVAAIAERVRSRHTRTGRWEGSLAELRCTLFFEQRGYHHRGDIPEGESLEDLLDLVEAIRQRWPEEPGQNEEARPQRRQS